MTDTTSPKPFVFVLMPFAQEYDDIYKLGIKAACQDAGAYCERVDEQIYTESILERVYNQIAKADLIVADMSGRNPNVFYETGYAHALDKRVIHLTQNAEDIPFDLKHFPHIVYEKNISKLKDELTKRVGWLLRNPHTATELMNFNIEVYINDQNITENPMVHVKTNFLQPDIPLKYKFHNIGNSLYDFSESQFGLVCPNLVKQSAFLTPPGNMILKSVYLNDNEQMWILPFEEKIYPESWTSFTQMLWTEYVQQAGTHVKMCFRVFTEIKPLDFPFTLEFLEK